MSIFSIELEAKNIERNHYRFYRVDVKKDLFNYWVITSIYGRIGTRGARRCFSFIDMADVEIKIKDILKRRKSAPMRIGTSYEVIENYDPHKILRNIKNR